MKTIHLALIIGLIFFTAIFFGMQYVSAQTSPTPNDLVDVNVFNMKAKNMGLPGYMMEISGNLVTKDPIKIILSDPNGTIVNSATTFSDRNGDFTSELKMPIDPKGGIWKIVGNSGMYHRELNFTVSSYSSIQTCYGFHCTSNSTGITTTKPNTYENHISLLQSPLKQFKSGIVTNAVKCTGDLYLVIKTEDDSPACVKLDTAYILIKRSWATSESAYPQGNPQFVLKTNSTMIPGHLPRHSGVRVPYQELSQFINHTGFDGVYNVTLMFRGTPQDYVLKPGTTGTITFKIEAMAELSGQQYPEPLPKSLNLTNYAVFYHEITSPTILSKYPGVTMDDNGHFRACFTRPASGGTCIGGPYDVKGQVEAYVVDHPGVNVLFEPPSEKLPLGTHMVSQIITMTITADGDAPQGTYLVEVPSFGEFLLTVGTQPYHE